jgi:hypothetical protein
MNIVLIGSCLDSHNLSKELNKKMKNSVVFRIDLLKNLKNIIPFTTITVNNNGAYLGDIESIEFDKISDTEKDIAKAFQASVKLMENSPSFGVAMSIMKSTTPTLDRVTRNFDALSLTLLRVVSGIQTPKQMERYMNGNSSAIMVYLEKPASPLFNVDITKEQFLTIKDSGKYENHLFLTAENLDSLLKDEVFDLLLNPTVKENKSSDNKAVVEEKKGTVEREFIVHGGVNFQQRLLDAAELHFLNPTRAMAMPIAA